jgi:hypothetical protein
MVTQVVANLQVPLSQVRLQEYRPPDGSDLEMITNYFWDIALAEALLPALHGVELALRNSLHTQLTLHYGSNMWFYMPNVLEPGQLSQLAGALRQLADRRTQPTDGHIVAELTFGFWVTLISDRYQQRLWQPNGYALLKSVFPNVTGLSRQQIHQRYNLIRRELRNRVFHHEAIWDRPNLQQEHRDIREAIRWISPTLEHAISGVDRFPQVLLGRAQFQTDLRAHLGM